MKPKELCEFVTALAAPIAAEVGCEIWDVQFVKEAGQWFLRVKLDAPQGVNIQMCEHVYRGLDEPLDEADPISFSYILEVGSPGVGRVLRTDAHFEKFMGSLVDVRLYKAEPLVEKNFTAVLQSKKDGEFCFLYKEDAVCIPESKVALCRLHEEVAF